MVVYNHLFILMNAGIMGCSFHSVKGIITHTALAMQCVRQLCSVPNYIGSRPAGATWACLQPVDCTSLTPEPLRTLLFPHPSP